MSNLIDVSGLQTEARNPRSADIDNVSTEELCQIINNEDATIANIVQSCIPTIAGAIDALTPRVRQGGRVLYVGAGTSGRLGVLDASEIPPTYSASPEQFVALIAGGDVALRKSQEGAEDSPQGAVDDLRALNLDGSADSLIGIASSGRTPYVLSSLAFAKSKGCLTIGIACAAPSAMASCGNVDFMISAVTGPEVVTGSTRMKAGTATKLMLNMLSTGVMIRTGKTFGNIMVDVKPSNIKLHIRARRILREMCGGRCPESDEDVDKILRDCDQSVKVAAISIWLGVSAVDARYRLQETGGVLAPLLKAPSTITNGVAQISSGAPEYVLCVDGGGSNCRAVLRGRRGLTAEGKAGPCNPSDIGIDAAVAAIRLAIRRAMDTNPATLDKRIDQLHLAETWIGLAGCDRKPLDERMRMEMTKVLGNQAKLALNVTNDIELLATAAAHQSLSRDVVVLVAGTGSIAVRYQRQGGKLAKVGRAGGWGALLGDDGSGFDIGRQAIRATLRSDNTKQNLTQLTRNDEPQDPLPDLIHKFFQPESKHNDDPDLLTSVLISSSDDAPSASYTKLRIASCAKAVVDVLSTSEQAQAIISSAMRSLLDLILSLNVPLESDADDTALVLTGGLMQSNTLQQHLRANLAHSSVKFGHVEFVDRPASIGAAYLASRAWQDNGQI